MHGLTALAARCAATTTVAALALSMGPAVAAPSPTDESTADRAARAGWPDDRQGPRPTVDIGALRLPAPNPYLSLLPDPGAVDWGYWRTLARQQAQQTARERARLEEPLTYDEEEPDNLLGSNDTQESAEPIDGFGTGSGEEPGVSILGNSAVEPVRYRSLQRPDEDNGSIRKAAATRIPGRAAGVRTRGRIGDGPHGEAGSGSGDFDYFRVRVPQGRQIVTTIKAARDSDLAPLVAVWGARGGLRDFDFPRRGQASLTVPLPAGTYYVMAGGCCTYPRNRFKSGSGTGAESEGAYTMRIAVSRPDRDFYAVDLEAGDELGGTLDRADQLRVFNPSGDLVFGSRQDASFIYPEATPMPGGGRAVVDHTVSEDGRYAVEVTYGSGSYQADLEVYETGGEESTTQGTQTLFLDFDGERLNTGIYGGPGVRELSPLSAFLGRWGLATSDEDALIDRIVRVVTESVERDLERRGENEDFDVEILNSRDDEDPFGEPNVSRLIVGGTIRESGIPTIGIAQSIDPGNFDREETGLILLDVLSSPKDGNFGNASANFWMKRRSDRVAWVGQVVGNIAAHEAGHFIGNWHVDQFDGRPNLMDQGGQFRGLYGPGPDNVGGTADDRDVDFGRNQLNPFEGFRGTEDTLNRSAFGLTNLVARLLG